MRTTLAALLLAMTGCNEAAPTVRSEPSSTPASSTITPAPSPITPSRAPSPVQGAGCRPADDVKPAALFTGWPALVGHRVRFAGRIERVVDITEFVITAGGRDFIVNGLPDRPWSGAESHSFTVLGSSSVGVHGRTVMPLLLLDDSECGA